MKAETVEKRLMTKLASLIEAHAQARTAFNDGVVALMTTQIIETAFILHRRQQAMRLAEYLIESRGEEQFSQWLDRAIKKQSKALYNTTYYGVNGRTLDRELHSAWTAGCADVLGELMEAREALEENNQ